MLGPLTAIELIAAWLQARIPAEAVTIESFKTWLKANHQTELWDYLECNPLEQQRIAAALSRINNELQS